MNKKNILIVALMLAAVLALVLVLGGNKEAATENKPKESKAATEESMVNTEVPADTAETTTENPEES